MKKLTLFVLSLIAFTGSAQWSYTATTSIDVGNPGGLNTETDVVGQGNWTTIMSGPQSANSWSPNVTIPFAFNFYGLPVTQLKASQNGLVTFDVASTLLPNANTNLPSALLPDNTICGYWDEFTGSAPTGSGDDIRTNTYGTAPNRQFWVRWYSFEMGNPSVNFNYFSIVLEESSNKVFVVDQYGSTAGDLSFTVGVQLNSSTAVQFGTNNTAQAGNGSGLADNDYYEFSPIFLAPDNIGVSGLTSPLSPFNAGLNNVDVVVSNYGNNSIASFDIGWEVDGIPQTTFTYSGAPIAAGSNSAALSIGSYNFPSNGFTDLKFWSLNPNGNIDGFFGDDTLEISVCASLSGTYTIGGMTADYNTLNDAVTAMTNCGISGPVTFNVNPGTYAESLTIGTIDGSSATNTITFNGGGVSTITHDGTGQYGVVHLINTDYITFKNFTIINTASTDGWGFHLQDTANYVTIDSCSILLDVTATADVCAVVLSGLATNDFTEGNAGNFVTISNNTIVGGEMGIHIEGPSSVSEWVEGIEILNNDISFVDDYGIYVDNSTFLTVNGNNIHDIRSAGGDGMSLFDQLNVIIEGNTVVAPDYGIYVADNNFDQSGSIRSRIINNMTVSSSDYGIYLDDVNDIDIWHNTAVGNPGIRINDFGGLDIRNNIFVSQNDYAFETDESANAELVDYNAYYTPATNGLFINKC